MITKESPKSVVIRGISDYCKLDCFTVSVYDDLDNLIFYGRTNKHGYVKFEVCEEGEYRVKVKASGGLSPASATRWLCIGNCDNQGATFIFNSPYKYQGPQPVQVMFILTDANYENLPISKGEITLWQDHIM